jgi:hypothetical protein
LAKLSLVILRRNMTAYSQDNFASFVNKLFLNAFSDTPDSSVRKFLNDFVPIPWSWGFAILSNFRRRIEKVSRVRAVGSLFSGTSAML